MKTLTALFFIFIGFSILSGLLSALIPNEKPSSGRSVARIKQLAKENRELKEQINGPKTPPNASLQIDAISALRTLGISKERAEAAVMRHKDIKELSELIRLSLSDLNK